MLNEILYKATLDLTDQKVSRYLQSMITVLEDKKTLSTDPAAQAAVKVLKEILQDDLIITTTEEAKAVQTALDAIRVAKNQESIRKLEVESRISLQQQTFESATEIHAVKEGEMGQVANTVSREFKQTYEQDIKKLKLGHEDHENRLRAVEAEQHDLKTKQFELEKNVFKLKIIEEKHQTRIEYLKLKQGLQKRLVDEYQIHYVKTWIYPLMTQENDVNISDVYVSPKMVVEEEEDGINENIIKFGKGKEKKSKYIESYCDIFCTNAKRNRKIFIVGDLGTGKSSFCKMMMQNWCSSITKRRNTDELGDMDRKGGVQEEKCDKYNMSQFDFLFFIPLSNMSGYYDTVDMIKAQFEDYRTLVDDIFFNDSERCLILADGLDEWTPPRASRPLLHHVTVEIPTSYSAHDSTIITTSRPSSRGVLNMKSSEYDLKVTLFGLGENSVALMIEKYMKFLNNTSAFSDFKTTLLNLTFKEIRKTPMLLQQIIWLYCKGYDIGKSRSSIYSNIINIVLAWELDKSSAAPVLHDFKSSSLENLSLPTSVFDRLRRCQENRKLLLLLGKIAYDAYITCNVMSPVFGRYKMKQLGLSDDDISAILRTSILTEVNSTDPTQARSMLSFIHTSYVEFFAALYICSSYLSAISDAHSSGTSLSILEGLIAVTPETSLDEILRLENVLIMICGLVPGLIEHVCECVYMLTPKNENIYPLVAKQIQDLTFDCLSEHNSLDQETIVKLKLRHLFIHLSVDETRLKMCLSGLEPTSLETCSVHLLQLSHQQNSCLLSFLSQAVSLRTLEIEQVVCTKDTCEGHIIDLTNHRELQSIELSYSKISVSGIHFTCLQSCKILHCKLSHEQCSLLLSWLSQAVSLQTLKMRLVVCTKDTCEGHIIDLTSHRELQSIEISDSKISVSGINHTCLHSCKISYCELPHEQCSLLSSCLSQAVSLRTLEIDQIVCTKDTCEGHIIDLTSHRELQSIEVSDSIISVSSINYTCPQFCKILHCKLSHEQCSLLLSWLSQAVSLQTLKMRRVLCTKDTCEGHIIDLTSHRELQSIEISDSIISVSGISHTCLQSCKISYCELSHEQCSLLSSCLSQAVSLRTLEIDQIDCTKDTCGGHIIDLTSHRELQSIEVSDSVISVSGINYTCPQFCKISYCELSHEQCSLLSSCLSQAVSLRTLEIDQIVCTKDTCEGHIIDLTSHRELQSIEISDSIISVSGINHTCLQSCKISYCKLSHEQCSLLLSCLSQAVSLQTLEIDQIVCTKDTCEGHIIDLTSHRELQSIEVSDSTISVSGINYTCPQSCKISYCELSHEQCSLLSSCLSQAVSLQALEIRSIVCTEEVCDGHFIDLSNHIELQTVIVFRSELYVSSINPILLKSCNISNHDRYLSHEHCASLCSSLSLAELLHDLVLKGIKCTEDACEGHYLDLTYHKQLETLIISRCNTISITGINPTCLKYCTISQCNLSHEQCASLCTFLSKAINLRIVEFWELKCTKERCEGHYLDLSNHKQLYFGGQIKSNFDEFSLCRFINNYYLE